jgi:protein involved in polysaccharide export with SLBB domain
MGLGREPDVSVEVSQFRPFYIVGQVAQPGEFPYRPGLTVLQAISIAGGLKTRQDTVGRYEREIISGRSDVDLLRLSKINLMAKRARLQAEQAQASNIAFPQSFLQNQADKSVAAAMQQESAIFETRRKGQETQLKALAELAEFLKKEQESLTAHLAFQDRQLELYQKDLDGIATLVKKGFATESRQTALERSLVQARSDRLSAETSLLRAQQELSRTDLSVLEMKNRYDNEVRVSLRETQSQLEDIERRSETASRLLYDSELTAPRLANQNRKAAQSEPDYTIVRQSSGVNSQLKADENTPVRPGDTVKVEIPYIENNDGFDISTPDRAGTSSIGDTGPQLQSAQ